MYQYLVFFLTPCYYHRWCLIGLAGLVFHWFSPRKHEQENAIFCSQSALSSLRSPVLEMQKSLSSQVPQHTHILFTFCASESGHHCGHCHHCGNIKWFCRIMLWSMLQNISFVKQKRNIINCLLLFKFYFKDQRCEDVSMITMMIKHQFHRDDDTEQRMLVIIMMIRVADHHGPWWWWSSSWFMVMILVMGHDDNHHGWWWWWFCQEEWWKPKQEESSTRRRRQLGVCNHQ